MKIIHTSDWYLGSRFFGHDRKKEMLHFFSWLLEVIRLRVPDVLVVSGNVFDSAQPEAWAEGACYDFLKQAMDTAPGLQVVMVAGQRDSAEGFSARRAFMEKNDIHIRGLVPKGGDGQPDVDDLIIPLRSRDTGQVECVCFALPYLRGDDMISERGRAASLRYYYDACLSRLRRSSWANLPCIATGHFYAANAAIDATEHYERIVPDGNEKVDPNFLSDTFCYVALGMVDKAQCVNNRPATYYAGSPLPMAFSEKKNNFGVNVVDVSAAGGVNVNRLEYTPLRNLLIVPQNGEISPDRVRYELDKLPERQAGGNDDKWPYLEMKVMEHSEPELINEVMKKLANKAVRFCRITATHRPSNRQEEALQLERLRTITPLEMAQRIYKEQKGEYMPAEVEKRFRGLNYND